MSTYATVQDYQDYTDLVVNTPTGGLQKLLDEAENDVDKIIIHGSYKTGAVIGFNIQGATGGSFQVELPWLGVTYMSLPVMWDEDSFGFISALQSATDPYGNPLPSGVWQPPEQRFYNQPWAQGPFPAVPIVVQAFNSLARQRLAVPVVTNSTIVGTVPEVQEIIGGGLRQNPYLMAPEDSYALNQAVCAQAEYRDQMGSEFFARAQWASVSGPEFKTTGKLPSIGPKVLRELVGTDLIQRGARALPGTRMGRQQVYVPVGGTPIPDDWRMI